jgi:hypothetical protein
VAIHLHIGVVLHTLVFGETGRPNLSKNELYRKGAGSTLSWHLCWYVLSCALGSELAKFLI